MSYTRVMLANRALSKLLVVGAGQTAESEDVAQVDAIIPAVVAHLASAQIYNVSDLADIDEAAFEWVADFLAYMAAPDFGMPIDDTKRQRAEFMLKLISATGPTYQAQTAEHF
jgi:hypothetical protein